MLGTQYSVLSTQAFRAFRGARRARSYTAGEATKARGPNPSETPTPRKLSL